MKIVLSVFVLVTAWTAGAQGTFEGVVSHANSSPVFTSPTSGTFGYTFQTTATNWMAVTQLGCFNDIFDGNPSVNSVQVGLWTSGGALLASSVITRSSALFNESRYESITPVDLNAGQIYHIGAYGGAMSVEICGPAVSGTVTMGPSMLLGATTENAGGFGFPSEVAGTSGLAYLAPNFRWFVPEPSSALLLGLAALLFVFRQRRHL